MHDDILSSDAPRSLDNADPPAENEGEAAGRQRESHMGFVRALATIAFVVALPIALLTTNIRLLINAPAVYNYAFDRYDAEETTGLSRADLDGTSAALRHYFNNNEETFFHTVTEDGLPASVFNPKETRHMEDVKRLVVWTDRVQELSVVYVLLYVVAFFIWAREGNVRQLALQCVVGLALGTVFVGAIAVFAAFGFDAAFTRFHQLLFANGDWQLDPASDHLIQMFPEKFWRDMTIALGAMCALEALLVGGASALYLIGSRTERRHLAAALDVNASRTQAA